GAFGWEEAESAHVYRLLRSMEKCGEVTSRWCASASGPARRVYAITPQGAMNLALWFVRLGELHSALHLFLERYVQLEDVGDEHPLHSGHGELSSGHGDYIRRMRR
nr:helix-turn-helix transcriptional regulator [Streptomyces sp. DSM 41633]